MKELTPITKLSKELNMFLSKEPIPITTLLNIKLNMFLNPDMNPELNMFLLKD